MTNTVLDIRTEVRDPHTGLDDTAELAAEMAKCLAGSYVLMAKTQAYHWNVAGILFHSVHVMTEEHYKDLFGAIDDLAERIRALGRPAPSMLAEMIALSDIEESAGKVSTEDMIRTLVHDHEKLARRFRESAAKADEKADMVTADMLVARMAFHEKAVWMLSTLLEE